MKTERHRPASYKAIARRFTAFVLGLWVAAMGLLTWAVAKDFYHQIDNLISYYVTFPTQGGRSIDSSLPGATEMKLLDSLTYPIYRLYTDQLLPIVSPHTPNSYGSGDWIWGKWDLMYGFEYSLAYYDADGAPVVGSGSWIRFPYMTEAMWADGETDACGYTYIDLLSIKDGQWIAEKYISDQPLGDVWFSYFCPLLRLTGYFEGNEFHPVVMERGYSYVWDNIDETASPMQAARSGRLEWETLFDYSAGADRDLVTIYGWDADGYHYYPSEAFTVDGTRYENLRALQDSQNWFQSEHLTESILISSQPQEYAGGEYRISLAVRCWPLQYAMFRMIWVYVISLALVLILLKLILGSIKRNLTAPLAWIAAGNGLEKPYESWQEPYALQEYYVNSKETIHESKTQIQQLSTALDYAKDAEENRRQLISNLTHELKTPLAVIHGYAEGLQAGIAEEKREQYLAVILEETEKMDAMVLQMLDLSRLEAGKVRLSADTVNLLAMIESIFEKLKLSMDAKELTVHYGFCQDFTVIADESRIRQVITNLAANAIKYTPAGGEIWITAFTRKGMAHISMDNTSPPLSDEALEKVFTSFYRADPSRTEAGTGLGLAIVKSIVELHRGTCAVRNVTRDGHSAVEFSFTLPMG